MSRTAQRGDVEELRSALTAQRAEGLRPRQQLDAAKEALDRLRSGNPTADGYSHSESGRRKLRDTAASDRRLENVKALCSASELWCFLVRGQPPKRVKVCAASTMSGTSRSVDVLSLESDSEYNACRSL